MASINKAISRDRKYRKRRYGIQVDNKGIFTLVEAQRKRDLEIKKNRKAKVELALDN